MRAFLVALFMALASCAYAQVGEGGDGQGDATTEQRPAQNPPWTLPVDIIEDQAEAEARKSREQRSEQRELDDLAAQQGMNEATQKMADYSVYQTGLVFVGTLILFYTLYLTRQANKAARDAVDVTSRIGEAQTRAYLSAGDFYTKVEQTRIVARVTLKNTGQTPARNVRTNIGWASDPPPFKEELHAKEVVSAKGRGTIGAGGRVFVNVTTDRFADEPEHSLTETQIGQIVSGEHLFWIVGVIEYDDVFGHHHLSRFRYYLIIEEGNVGFSPCLEGNEET